MSLMICSFDDSVPLRTTHASSLSSTWVNPSMTSLKKLSTQPMVAKLYLSGTPISTKASCIGCLLTRFVSRHGELYFEVSILCNTMLEGTVNCRAVPPRDIHISRYAERLHRRTRLLIDAVQGLSRKGIANRKSLCAMLRPVYLQNILDSGSHNHAACGHFGFYFQRKEQVRISQTAH
jgi:hypothetical protein